MEKLSLQEEINSNKGLRQRIKYTCFVEQSELEKIKESDTIEIRGEHISLYFLKNMLKNKQYLEYIRKFFNNEIEKFYICSVYNNDIIGNVSYTKSSLIDSIKLLIEDNEIVLSKDEESEYKKLKDLISFDKFLDKTKSEYYSISIDNKKYAFPVSSLVYIMTTDDKQFNYICTDDSVKYIDGVPKAHFIYAAYKYFSKSGAFHNYDIPEKIYDRFEEIRNFQKIDIDALNKILKTEGTKHKEFEISSDLREAILGDMPNFISDIEKAIYIYIRMCKTLTYDEEYYAAEQKGTPAKKHKDISYVSRVTPQNNKVVCFEFNIIYARFLDELGIKFKTIYKGVVEELYGNGHAYLDFRCGKYLVRADSVTSILRGDLAQAKVNRPLKGLKSFNRNIDTYKEFNELVDRVYRYIISKESEKKSLHVESFKEIMSEYIKKTSNVREVSIEERLSILIDNVNSSKMVGIDSISYALQLEEILFNSSEHKNNIFVTVLRSNNFYNGEKIAVPCIIFTLNSNGHLSKNGKNTYYYFRPNNDLRLIDKEELQLKFDSGELEYIGLNSPPIPEINEKNGVRK